MTKKNISEKIIKAIEKQDIVEMAKIHHSLSAGDIQEFEQECRQTGCLHWFNYLVISSLIDQEIRLKKLSSKQDTLLLANLLINPGEISDEELISVATLLDSLLFARLYSDSYNRDIDKIYYRQRAGIFESLVSRLIKRRSYQEALMIAMENYRDSVDSSDADTRAWAKVFIQDIFEIMFETGDIRPLRLTKEMYGHIIEMDLSYKQKKFLKSWVKKSSLKV